MVAETLDELAARFLKAGTEGDMGAGDLNIKGAKRDAIITDDERKELDGMRDRMTELLLKEKKQEEHNQREALNADQSKIKKALTDIGVCGEISDLDGYQAACAMPNGHPGKHGWEPGVGQIKLFCRTMECKDKGGFITRTVEDAKKNMYACDSCGKPMVR